MANQRTVKAAEKRQENQGDKKIKLFSCQRTIAQKTAAKYADSWFNKSYSRLILLLQQAQATTGRKPTLGAAKQCECIVRILKKQTKPCFALLNVLQK